MIKELFNRNNVDWVKKNIYEILGDPATLIRDQYDGTDKKYQGDKCEKYWAQIMNLQGIPNDWIKNWGNTYSYLNGLGADFIVHTMEPTIQDVKSTTSITSHSEVYFQRLKYHSRDDGNTWTFYSNGLVDDKYLADELIYFDTDKKWALVLDVDKIRDFYFNHVAQNPSIWDHNPDGHIEDSNDGGITKAYGFFIKICYFNQYIKAIKKLYVYELDNNDNIINVRDESFRLFQDELFGNIKFDI